MSEASEKDPLVSFPPAASAAFTYTSFSLPVRRGPRTGLDRSGVPVCCLFIVCLCISSVGREGFYTHILITADVDASGSAVVVVGWCKKRDQKPNWFLS